MSAPEELPEEREIRFIIDDSTTTLEYNPRALAKCLAGVFDFTSERQIDRVKLKLAVQDCLCPSLYALNCAFVRTAPPLTPEDLDDLPMVIVERLTDEVWNDFVVLANLDRFIN